MGIIRSALALRRVMKDARRPRAELDELTRKRLHRILLAAKNVPYYREYMVSIGYDPATDYGGVGDLKRFPILTKAVLNANGPDRFLNEKYDKSKLFTDMTSGSTGVPLQVWREPEARALQMACWMRVLYANRYSVRDKVMSFTSPARAGEGRSVLQRFGLLRRLPIDFNAAPAEQLDAILRYRPSILYGNRSSFDLIMQEMQRRGITIDCVKTVLVAGETITDHVRCNCEKCFGVPLTEWYGSVEGVNAYQTPERNGLCLSEDLKFYEFVDQDGNEAKPGEMSRIIATTLFEKAMPLIRYDQGDTVVYKIVETPRGERVRRIERVIGRNEDKARLSDGRTISFYFFRGVFNKYAGLRQYRIIQEKPDLFRIVLAADASYVEQVSERMAGELHGLLGSAADFRIERVDDLPLDKSGKVRTLVSEVN